VKTESDGIRDVKREASSLLRRLQRLEEEEQREMADDVLLFLYRLRDGYEVLRSDITPSATNELVHLNDVVYQLESSPERTLRSDEWRALIARVLTFLVEGTPTLVKKGR
jgi:hypothetical protein